MERVAGGLCPAHKLGIESGHLYDSSTDGIASEDLQKLLSPDWIPEEEFHLSVRSLLHHGQEQV
jgi:hypothetical protein